MLMPLSGSANLRLMASSRTFKHARILIVDDEPANVDMLKRLLEQSGYSRIETTCDPREAAALYVDMRPDLILLDLHMPHMDGFAVLDQLNDLVEASYLPILMLTARDEDVDKIVGLELGADDYVTKPFNPRELVARVKAILRRAEAATSGDATDASIIRAGDLAVDRQRREARAGDRELTLRTKEFDLLAMLAEHAGIVLTREQLLDRVWGYNFYGETRTVDVHVQHVRAKLAGSGVGIQTVRGVGYKLVQERDG